LASFWPKRWLRLIETAAGTRLRGYREGTNLRVERNAEARNIAEKEKAGLPVRQWAQLDGTISPIRDRGCLSQIQGCARLCEAVVFERAGTSLVAFLTPTLILVGLHSRAVAARDVLVTWFFSHF